MTATATFLVLGACVWSAAAILPLHSHAPASDGHYPWREAWYDQQLDHFSFSTAPRTWKQRYLISDKYWQQRTAQSGPGSVFFYTGNEGPIDLFAENTGLMWSLAPKYDALIIFAEHRYYGKSMPFGAKSFEPGHIDYLSSEQALADYAVLLRDVLPAYNATSAAVIAFGGSYGGMLASWFRIKYPDTVAGAIAASAPGVANPESFSRVATETYSLCSTSGPNCVDGIRRSWGIMESLGASQKGREKLVDALGLCAVPDSADAVTGEVFPFLSAAWQYMAMADYPYAASFLGPMPAWPVSAACSNFAEVGPGASDATVLATVRAAYSVFYNYTGQAGDCFNVSAAGASTLGAPTAWNFQACTEMLLPAAQDGTKDMFYPQPWNLTEVMAQCRDQFGTLARPHWEMTNYGGKRLNGASNIVYSNGNLDPWSAGGVQHNVSVARDVVAVWIDQGAHHLDLRAPNSADPESVKQARRVEASYITKWTEQWHADAANRLNQRLARSLTKGA